MSDDFGHLSRISNGVCIDAWGTGPFLLTVNGQTHRFEDSDRVGPAKVNQNGDLRENPYWPERHPFWRAHWCWLKQGRRLAEDGKTCIWDNIEPEVSIAFNRRGEKVRLAIDPYDYRTIVLGPEPAP